jgi:hypothetical protein
MDIQGKVIKVNEVEHHASDFTKQTIIIEYGETYPKKVELTFVKEKIEMLRNIAVGQAVKCHINIESREHNERWYTEIRCWKMETI